MIAFTDTQLLAWLSAFLLPFFRVLGLFTSAPLLSSRQVTARVRIVLAAAVSSLAAPWVAVSLGTQPVLGSPQAWAAIAHEVLIGLSIGFAARLVFAAFELAGEIIGLQMGFSFAGFFDPSSGAQGTAIGSFFGTTGSLLFVAMNGPLLLIATVVQSFEVFPVGAEGFAVLGAMNPARLGAELFALALTVALPFLALMLFVNLTLGVASRVAPQLNLFGLGMPVSIVAGLLLLALAYPWVQAPFVQAMQRALTLFGGP